MAQIPNSGGPIDAKLIADLAAASRILATQGVVDGFGHVSMRHPLAPDRYFMARSIAPALVTPADIIEYDLDSNPCNANGRNSFLERFIHGEIYKARPDVKAIVHSHAPPIIPFGVTSIPLQPMYHRAAFISIGVPVFEIRDAAGITDMLIRDAALGRALAKSIADKPAVLMRGHGATVVGPSIPRVVARSIFLALNAKLQAQAMIMAQGGAIKYLDPAEARLIEAREGYGLGRAWKAWKRRALKQP